MLNKKYRLRKNRDFQSVYRAKDSVAAGTVVLYIMDNNGYDLPRIGFSISKKVGNAVVRNRCRRVLREAVRLRFDDLNPGRDYVFVGRHSLAGASFSQVERDVSNALKRGSRPKTVVRDK